MNTAPALRRDLQASLATTSNVLDAAVATLRQQLSDQITIAQTAFDQEDLETWATAARHAANAKKSLEENLELQMKSRATVFEAATASLIAELSRRALKENDAEAQKALKIPVAKKGGARVRG